MGVQPTDSLNLPPQVDMTQWSRCLPTNVRKTHLGPLVRTVLRVMSGSGPTSFLSLSFPIEPIPQSLGYIPFLHSSPAGLLPRLPSSLLVIRTLPRFAKVATDDTADGSSRYHFLIYLPFPPGFALCVYVPVLTQHLAPKHMINL